MKLNLDHQLDSKAYFREVTEKDLIVLHFTAGPAASGAIATFKASPKVNGFPVSTAYVVDVDGTVYKLFDDQYWSYHLGIRGPAARNHFHDRRSVGIEIANVGPLRPHNGMLCYHPPQMTFRTPYCSLSDTLRHVKLQTPYRNEKFFATFQPQQIDAVAELVVEVATRHKIPQVIPANDKLFQFDMNYFNAFQGVASHVNFRADKTDLAPLQGTPIYNEILNRGFDEQRGPL